MPRPGACQRRGGAGMNELKLLGILVFCILFFAVPGDLIRKALEWFHK